MWSVNQCRCSRGSRSTKAFDTNALQFESDFVGRLCETPIISIPPPAERCYRNSFAHIELPCCKVSAICQVEITTAVYIELWQRMYPTVSVTKAQSGLPKLCRDKKAILITTHEKPVSVLLPIEDYEALIETMDLLANPTAMQTLRAAKAGKLKYRRLNLNDEDFGL